MKGNSIFHRFVKIAVLCWLGVSASVQAWAEQTAPANWPQEIKTRHGVVVIYQPQPETLKNNQLKARAAVALELKDTKETIFGSARGDGRGGEGRR